MPFFARRFPKVTLTADRMVVDSGKVITAGSAFAHADLMLNLVSRLASPALASLSSKYLVLDSRASHSRYMVIDHLRRADPVLQSLEGYVMQNIDRQISLGELARKLAVSQRTLARKVESASGMTPIEFVHRVRISHAVHLLETTKKPVDEIATLVGYADSSAFRKIFRRYAGDTPKARRFPT
jgi:transcriptional regulator GlxA family with amidase domain